MILTRGVVLAATLVALATAAPVIEFQSTATNGHSGSISYDPRYGVGAGPGGIGTGGTAIGKNIDIDFLKGIGTANNDGVSAVCFSCTIDFQTGMNTNNQSANGTLWSFNGGGSFIVTGGMDLNGNGVLDPTDIQPGSALLLGVFNNSVNVTAPSPDLKFTSATLINTLDDRVDGFFGVPGQGVYDGVYAQTFHSTRARLNSNPTNPNYNRWRFSTYTPPGNTIPKGMMDGSVVNTLVVPEPVSVLLSATAAGILVLCMRNRRRTTV